MAASQDSGKERPFRLHLEAETVLLLVGTALALAWANLPRSPEGYQHFVHWPAKELSIGPLWFLPQVTIPLDLHFLATDGLMAIFFGLAAKEVFESFLPGGALSSLRKAALPLLATAGGMVGPAALFLGGVLLLDRGDLTRGWAIPCATDIAFSYAVARMIFGTGHPAIAFLLLLAIVDDGAGLVIIAGFYSDTSADQLLWLVVAAAAVVIALGMKWMNVRHFAWYLIFPGALSWLAFQGAGVHAALGLVPIIPCMPHARRDIGMFVDPELHRPDALSQFEEFFEGGILSKWLARPLANVSILDLILFFFALTNAGVVISASGAGTFLVLFGLVIGKPAGILLFTYLGEKGLGLKLPERMNYRDVLIVGCAAGIGFTVALFVADAAFRGEAFQSQLDEVKIGALASLVAAVLAIVVAVPKKSTPPKSRKGKRRAKRRVTKR